MDKILQLILQIPIALAGQGPGTDVTLTIPSPFDCATITDCFGQIMGAIIKILTPVLVAMILWGGALIMTSRDDKGQLTKGRNVIKYAIIGFVIILLATGIGDIVKDILGS